MQQMNRDRLILYGGYALCMVISFVLPAAGLVTDGSSERKQQ